VGDVSADAGAMPHPQPNCAVVVPGSVTKREIGVSCSVTRGVSYMLFIFVSHQNIGTRFVHFVQCDNYNLKSNRRCNNSSRINLSGHVGHVTIII